MSLCSRTVILIFIQSCCSSVPVYLSSCSLCFHCHLVRFHSYPCFFLSCQLITCTCLSLVPCHKLLLNSEAASFEGRVRRLIASPLRDKGCPNLKPPLNASFVSREIKDTTDESFAALPTQNLFHACDYSIFF